MAVEGFRETIAVDSLGQYAEYELDAKVEAKKILLKVGNIDVDMDYTGWGKVLVDGVKIPRVKSLTVRVTAGEMPVIELSILPGRQPPAEAKEGGK